METLTEISIVIPVYKSGNIIRKLTNQIDSALKNIKYEIILVNDCSPDESWSEICQLCGENGHIVGVNLRKNFGQDGAIMAGLSQVSGAYVVIMDDDLQHSPYDIERLYLECKKGYDVCYANFKKKKQSWWKNMGSWLNGKVAEYILSKPAGIYLSPFEIITKEIALEVVKYGGPYPYVQGLILNTTSNITQIDIEHHERFEGKGNFNFMKSLSVFLKLVTGFSVLPLRIASWVGMISAFLGLLLSIYYLFEYIFLRNSPEGWTTLVMLLLLIGGLILTSLGIIGEYVGRIYLNINNKPQYIIKNIVNKK